MSLANFLFTPGLQRVFGATLLHPDHSFTLRLADSGRGSVQKQVDRLVDRLLLRRAAGHAPGGRQLMRRNQLNPVWAKPSAFASAQTFDYKYFKRYYGRTIMQPRPVLPSPVLSPPSGKASSARVENSEGALFEIQSQARYVFTLLTVRHRPLGR